MVNSNNVTRKFTMKEKLASLCDRGIIHRPRNRNKLYTGRCNLRFHTFLVCCLFRYRSYRHAGYGGKDRYHHSGRSRRKHEA